MYIAKNTNRYRNCELKNGVCFVEEIIDNGLGIVSFGLFFKFGSEYENSSNNGVFHVLEHFFGAKINEITNKFYAKYNAITTREYVCFFVKCNNTDCTKIIKLILHCFEKSIECSGLEKSKKIVINEIRLKEQRKNNDIDEELFYSFFGGESLALATEGSVDVINNLSFAKYEEASELFNPVNCIFSIAGQYSEEIRNSVVELVEEWSTGIKVYSLPDVLLNNEVKDISIIGKTAGLAALIGNVSECGLEKEIILRIINEIVGGNSNSHLYRVLRSEKSLCYYVYSSLLNYNRMRSIYIHIDAGNDMVDMIKETLIKCIYTMSITEEDIFDAKCRLSNNLRYNYETSSSIMTKNAIEILHKRKHISVKDYSTFIKDIDALKIKEQYDKMKKGRIVIVSSYVTK